MLWLPRCLATTALALATLGCFDTTTGALGHCSFQYVCLDPSDGACIDGGFFSAPQLPERVAVGRPFDLTAHCDREVGLYAGTLGRSKADGAFRIPDAGPHAFVARAARDLVVDFTHIHAAEVHAVRIWLAGGWGSPARQLDDLDFILGHGASLRGRSVSDAGTLLAGSFDYQWAMGDDTIARLATGDPAYDVSVQFECVSPGATSLTLTWDALSTTIPVVCKAGP